VLKDITLGQYFPGDTVIHRLDPRTKIISLIVFIAALFTAKSWISFGVIFVFLTVCVILSKLTLKTIFKGLKPLLIIIIFTAILNGFFTKGDVIVKFWIFSLTKQGLQRAALMILRIVMLITGSLLLTYTTSPIALTDGLEVLLSPLKKIHLPIHELSMMMSIALRFIPTLIEETDKIMSAQKARGADFETGNILEKAKALMPLLVPLFVSAFRRADELAVAMESRCYHGDSGRTRMKQLTMKWYDAVALVLIFVLLAVTIVLSVFGM
jgi:energy-coupling factor transport system permease protein